VNVKRITDEGLSMILHNQVKRPVNCVIKFYSNDCHLCHALQEYYAAIADSYDSDPNVVFYAYNVDDDPSVEKLLKFKGVPTIAIIKPDPDMPARRLSAYKILEEPEEPNKKTWYRVKDIKEFIEKEK
jgi:thiol-disulfide isomerase/thioredoxin|tara:strand:- start:369 stop:752 length:384 start_codon:yes stop_codon:yes gene_type:complete